jgi:tetratricopeptide (TPR) repeat protein
MSSSEFHLMDLTNKERLAWASLRAEAGAKSEEEPRAESGRLRRFYYGIGSVSIHLFLLVLAGLIWQRHLARSSSPAESEASVWVSLLGKESDRGAGLLEDEPEGFEEPSLLQAADLGAAAEARQDPFPSWSGPPEPPGGGPALKPLALALPDPVPTVDPSGEAPSMEVGGGDRQGGGSLYGAREGVARREAVRKGGGSPASESAVALGLEWLSAHQSPDGRWDLDGYAARCPASDRCLSGQTGEAEPSFSGYDPAVTGLALLAFLGAGHTHESGLHQETVKKAAHFLRGIQGPDGLFGPDGQGAMYNHGICTLALTELYGMTRDPAYLRAARKAVSAIAAAQRPGGGWDYSARAGGDRNDGSITGWQVLALRSALAAGVEVPPDTLLRLLRYLKTAADEQGALAYAVGNSGSARRGCAMTAVGLTSLLCMGAPSAWGPIARGSEALLANLPDPDLVRQPDFESQRYHNEYYWYYASMALHQVGGEPWRRWNPVMRDLLVSRQQHQGHLRGSWDPEGVLGRVGGRVYTTAISTLTLEVYYRYLPVYEGSDPLELLIDRFARAKPGERMEAIGLLKWFGPEVERRVCDRFLPKERAPGRALAAQPASHSKAPEEPQRVAEQPSAERMIREALPETLLDRLAGGRGNYSDFLEGACLVEEEESPERALRIRIELERLEGGLREKIPEGASARQKCRMIGEWMFDEGGFRGIEPKTDVERDAFYLGGVLERKRGDCVGLSLLYLHLARGVGLSLRAVRIPGHLFLCYRTGGESFYVEPTAGGALMEESDYAGLAGRAVEDLRRSGYLRELGWGELLAELLNGRGLRWALQGRWAEASRDLECALRLDPSYAVLYNNRGNVCRNRGELELAVQDYSRALSIDPRYADAYANRGVVQLLLARADRAAPDLDRAIDLDPAHAAAYVARGNLYFRKGRPDLAEPDLDRAIRHGYPGAEAHRVRGELYLATGRSADGERDFREAIRRDPKGVAHWCLLSKALWQQGRKEEAMLAVRRASDLDPRAVELVSLKRMVEEGS